MAFFGRFYLDKEKDIIVDLDLEDGGLVLRAPDAQSRDREPDPEPGTPL